MIFNLENFGEANETKDKATLGIVITKLDDGNFYYQTITEKAITGVTGVRPTLQELIIKIGELILQHYEPGETDLKERIEALRKKGIEV